MANVTKKAIREAKMNELAKLFGANTGVKVGRACTGKWRGTTDYSVEFNTGDKFFITNQFSYFHIEFLRHFFYYMVTLRMHGACV